MAAVQSHGGHVAGEREQCLNIDICSFLGTRWLEQKERLGLLMGILKAAWSWTSTYNHFNAEIPQREQARFVLHLMGNLMGIAGQLLSAFPNSLEKEEDSKP